jgi:hypothetical protein
LVLDALRNNGKPPVILDKQVFENFRQEVAYWGLQNYIGARNFEVHTEYQDEAIKII